MKASVISLVITLTSALVAASPQKFTSSNPCKEACAAADQCGSIENVRFAECTNDVADACSCKKSTKIRRQSGNPCRDSCVKTCGSIANLFSVGCRDDTVTQCTCKRSEIRRQSGNSCRDQCASICGFANNISGFGCKDNIVQDCSCLGG
ncbi:hypothetical protein LZ32DRAFT_60714 [Colletotrichum eremochloae]|nr:hypothetical protein LZ32DRAFT_60714 [Colletotrichum eremochloae]